MIDYISREAAIEKIRVAAGCAECDGNSSVICCCDFCDVYNAIRLIKRLPTADAEPVRHVTPICCGTDEYYGKWLRCPNCDFELNTSAARFCGGCGAKMDLEGEILNPERSEKEGISDGI